MAGKLISIALIITAIVDGVGIYYANVYAYYTPIASDTIRLISVDGNLPTPIHTRDYQGIDAPTSPIRYRACFRADDPVEDLQKRYKPFEGQPTPLNAPYWFECFKADEIAQSIKKGQAIAFIGQKNIKYGVDRVVVITSQGRGYVWHQLNKCGKKLYDGSPAEENCPQKDK